MAAIKEFMNEVQEIYSTDGATEHSYRPAISSLFQKVSPKLNSINDGKRMKFNTGKNVRSGALDFQFRLKKTNQVVGYLEAKDIDVRLNDFSGANREQHDLYVLGLDNLIYTNCLDWDFYQNGILTESVSIGELRQKNIYSRPKFYPKLEDLLNQFVEFQPQPITDSCELAKKLAHGAKLIKDIFLTTLKNVNFEKSQLNSNFELVRNHLIQNISKEEFADMYAETIAYGMLTARIYDNEINIFTRERVIELLPSNNPFLLNMLTYISKNEINDPISWLIDNLAKILDACNIEELMEGTGHLIHQNDPFFDFYETFLEEYNPNKRHAKGVWYTPEAAVRFITRAVDQVLIKEFGLEHGLADSSKIDRIVNGIKEKLHRVQILDPAVGTGTFLVETIKRVSTTMKSISKNQWGNKYIQNDLIPRIHGFEILMAPYAMCHVKLQMILEDLTNKFSNKENPRFSVYFTNSLEHGKEKMIPYLNWMNEELHGAIKVKQELPVMCIIGNPPYNRFEPPAEDPWLVDLMKVYRLNPNTQDEIDDPNKQFLNNTYVKFIRVATKIINDNEEGVLGFITSHSYLSGKTFRSMRWHLLYSFDKIWILDLHGNTIWKEVDYSGKPDQNIFDISPGVSIIIAIKTKNSNDNLARVWHGDIYGSRESKLSILERESIYENEMFTEIFPKGPYYYFEKIGESNFESLRDGLCLSEIFQKNQTGINSGHASFAFDVDIKRIRSRLRDFESIDLDVALHKYGKLLGKHAATKIEKIKQDIVDFDEEKLIEICYRPFDTRWTYYTGKSGVIEGHRNSLMKHMMNQENLALLTCSHQRIPGFNHVFVTKLVPEISVIANNLPAYVFPLYEFENDMGVSKKIVNICDEFHDKIVKIASNQENGVPDEFAIFDYIYGILHCNDYRNKFKESLGKNLPKIPYPEDSNSFWFISLKGNELRKLHLMDEIKFPNTEFQLSKGTDEIVMVNHRENKIRINDSQHFQNVDEYLWNFKIGIYQPAKIWLKDRIGKILSFDEINHYRKILFVLSETDRIMKTIKFSFDN